MRFFFLAGGLAGFTSTFLVGLWAGHDATLALRDAVIASFIVGWLMKRFRAVLLKAFTQTARENIRATQQELDIAA